MTAEPNDISTELSQKDPLTNDHENKYRLKAAAFLATISGFGFLAGFGGALAAVKKQEPTSFDQGLALRTSKRAYKNRQNKTKFRRGSNIHQLTSVQIHESGAALAGRALAYGSLWAVVGCGALFFSIWKLSGSKNLKDFREKAGSILPRIPQNHPPVGRTEFSGINDFLSYIIEEDKRNNKSAKKQD